jgi:Na+/H+-translocating membrane pyrophosphatase
MVNVSTVTVNLERVLRIKDTTHLLVADTVYVPLMVLVYATVDTMEIVVMNFHVSMFLKKLEMYVTLVHVWHLMYASVNYYKMEEIVNSTRVMVSTKRMQLYAQEMESVLLVTFVIVLKDTWV